MKTIVTKVEIPKSEVDAFIQPFLEVDLDGALQKISMNENLVPNITKIRKNTEKEKEMSPLGFLFTRVSIRNNNPVLTSRTPEELFDEQVRVNVARNYMILSNILYSIIENLIQKKGLNSENLSVFLGESDIYDEDKIQLVRIGLTRYFEEDFVSAIHILVPQIESGLRKILGNIGKPTTSFRNGAIQERTLDDILRVEELKNTLSEDVWYYLKVLLVDKVGDNLRNDVSHGLITFDRCTKNIATLVVHQLMILTRYGNR